MALCHPLAMLRGTSSTIAIMLLMASPAAAQLPPIFAQCADFRATPEAAIAACTGIIQSSRASPHNLAVTYLNRGNAWGIKQNPERAISDFSETIRIEPDNARAYNNRGIAFPR